MADVFESSFCTIAAASGNDAKAGLFVERNQLLFANCKLWNDNSGATYLYVGLFEAFQNELETLQRTSKFFTRAWIYQKDF
jgi:hypothetical protein